MKIPTPSFFKIRLVALILCFVLLCFFVGLLKGAFADWPGECTFVIETNPGYPFNVGSVREYRYFPETGYFGPVGDYVQSPNGWQNQRLHSYYYENGHWIARGNFIGLNNTNKIEGVADGTELPEGCPDPCQNEINQAIAACGGEENIDWTNYSEETCNLSCKCEAEKAEAELFCAAGYEFDMSTCTYECTDCEDFYNEAVALCADKGGIQSFNCNIENSFDPGVNNEPPSYTCVDDNQVTADPDDETGDPPEDPAEDPNPGPEDPDSDIANQWLAKIKENTDTIIDQNNSSNNYQANMAENLRRSVDNQGVINDSINNLARNLANIGAGLGDEVRQGVEEAMKDVEDGLQDIEDELEQINEGEFNPTEPPDPYATDEEYSVSDRLNEFLDEMRSTGVFSLPNKLSSSIPGGGSPLMTINGGDTYGSHTIDFSDYSSAILILRAAFQLAGMIIAIRIITLKR